MASRMRRLFGRHATDAMRWSGGCGRCWSPPGHRPGWCHLQKWSSSGTLRVFNAPKGCTARARSGNSGRLSEPSFPEDEARQAASFAFGRMAIGELAVYHAAADGRKVVGSRKAPSVGTWPAIPDKSLRVGGLVDTGWGLQPRRSKDPCGHSWMSDSLIPLQMDNRSSLGQELSRQPPLVRGGCHPRPDWHPD